MVGCHRDSDLACGGWDPSPPFDVQWTPRGAFNKLSFHSGTCDGSIPRWRNKPPQQSSERLFQSYRRDVQAVKPGLNIDGDRSCIVDETTVGPGRRQFKRQEDLHEILFTLQVLPRWYTPGVDSPTCQQVGASPVAGERTLPPPNHSNAVRRVHYCY